MIDESGNSNNNKKSKKLSTKFYEKELQNLQIELVKLQDWIQHKGLKVVVIFEGRDAAGKGGVIKRISQSLNPRVCKIVALGTPSSKEKSQWYFLVEVFLHLQFLLVQCCYTKQMKPLVFPE